MPPLDAPDSNATVLRDDAPREGLAEALKARVQSRVGVWKYPRWVEIVDSLPKTATGKIQRFKLRETT